MIYISASDSVKKEYLNGICSMPREDEKWIHSFHSENLKGRGLYNL
jgi:hypothetical protein